tara:strand:- start:9094 stop:9795 length:702 start_codon:yes stop_codon:yes gene_type:complete
MFSLLIESKEFNYRFQWLSLPVASLSIEFNEHSHANNDIKPHIKNFRLSTQGPLRLYRKYSSQGYIKYDTGMSWDYYLSGNDRGQPEEKHITYFYNMAPKIRKFIDDFGVSPIIVDPKLDKKAIDPFSVLFKTIDQLISERKCKNEYSVMDGKRRYRISVNLIQKNTDKNNTDILFHCKFTFIELKEEYKKWPFNKKERHLDVWFSSNLNYKPVRFYSKTPIGSVVGDYIVSE